MDLNNFFNTNKKSSKRRTPEGKIIKNWLSNTLKLTKEEVLNRIAELLIPLLEKRINEYLSSKGGLEGVLKETISDILYGKGYSYRNPGSIRMNTNLTLQQFIESELRTAIKNEVGDKLKFEITVSSAEEKKQRYVYDSGTILDM